MTTFYMTVGFPGSGKSTYASNMRDVLGVSQIVSSDSIREELFGREDEQGDPNEIFSLVHERVISELSKGNSTVLDATNLSYKHRMAFLQRIRKLNVEMVALLFATPFDACVERNESRSRVVPRHVMNSMRKSFVTPSYFEGWDKIDVIWDFEARDFEITSLFDELDGFEQDNPHHTMTVGEHCKAVWNILNEENAATFWTCQAGLLHDIGKLETKSFKNSKGDVGTVAHFYSHEAVSAYDSLFYCKVSGWQDQALLYVSSLISFHMRPYGATTEKSQEKLRKLVGDNMYDDLIILNDADKRAK